MTKYELEHMPKTETGQRMIARVSPVYENSLFMKRFYDALGAEWEPLRKIFTTLREQHFIDTVDWGILYLEWKYSLEPRPDLTLEERRARLGIKARTHRPLNPAVLERYIRENFGLETYLDEDEVGYIHVIANHLTEDGWRKLIPWLVKEKPAHLALKVTQHVVSYTGTNPDEPFEKPRVTLPGEVPLPKTPAEKKYYRRIFAGGALVVGSNIDLGLRRFRDSRTKVHAGNVQLIDEARTIAPRRVKDSKVVVHVGCPLMTFEHVLIDSKEIPLIARVRENSIVGLAIADSMLVRSDNLAEPPVYDWLKIFFKFPSSSSRRYITLKNPRENLTKEEIKAVADYAVEHDLLLNREGQEVNDAPRASLIARKVTPII